MYLYVNTSTKHIKYKIIFFSEKLRYYDIDSDEKKELERLRQSQRKHNLELKQLQADVDKLLFEKK